MNKTLKQIFNDPIETLLDDEMAYLSKKYIHDLKSKNIDTRYRVRINIAQNYNNRNLLQDKDAELVNSPLFINVMEKNNYEEGIKILDNYLNNIDYALKYIEEMIKIDNEDIEIEKFLRKLENQHGKKWLINLLLKIKPHDKLTFINCFAILKYIGNINDFKKHFNLWLEQYNSKNFDRGVDVYKICEDYINEIINYFPYLPQCK